MVQSKDREVFWEGGQVRLGAPPLRPMKPVSQSATPLGRSVSGLKLHDTTKRSKESVTNF